MEGLDGAGPKYASARRKSRFRGNDRSARIPGALMQPARQARADVAAQLPRVEGVSCRRICGGVVQVQPLDLGRLLKGRREIAEIDVLRVAEFSQDFKRTMASEMGIG